MKTAPTRSEAGCHFTRSGEAFDPGHYGSVIDTVGWRFSTLMVLLCTVN